MAGNTSVSSLMGSVASARAKQNAYNDAYAGYVYDNSSKTEDDLQQYSGYLKTRATQATDPSKQLEIHKSIQGATKSYNSAQIRRVGDSVLTGEASNTDKYKTIYGIMQNARSMGENAYADQLQTQLLGLSKTIQTEAKTAASHTKSANDQSVQYNVALAKRTRQLTDEALRKGQISPQEHADRAYNAMEMERQTYTDAVNGHHGPLTDSAMMTAQNDLFNLEHGQAYAKSKSLATAAANGRPAEYAKHTVLPDGTVQTETAALPGAQTTFQKDPKTGKMVPITTYQGGTQGKEYITDQRIGGRITPSSLGASVPVDSAGNPIPAGGKDANGNPVKPSTLMTMRPDLRTDSKFFGMPHYINSDPNAALQASHMPITTDDLKLGKGIGFGDYAAAAGQNIADQFSKRDQLKVLGNNASSLLGTIGSGLGMIGSGFNAMHNLPQTIMTQVSHANMNRAQVAAQALAQAKQAAAVKAQQQVAVNAAAARGTAQAKVLGPAATPAQVTAAMAVMPAKTASNPNPLPVQNTINQAFAVAKLQPTPPPAPKKNWWNNVTNTIGSWFK